MRQPPSERSVKLRKACNQCNATKVRCSGERDGCARCLNARTPCIYEESRVGKVPGARAKKKKIKDPQETYNPLSASTEQHSPISLGHANDLGAWVGPLPTSQTHELDTVVSWDSGIQHYMAPDAFGFDAASLPNQGQEPDIENSVFDPALTQGEAIGSNFFSPPDSLHQPKSRLPTDQRINSREPDQGAMSVSQNTPPTSAIPFTPPSLPSYPPDREEAHSPGQGSTTVLNCCDMASQLEKYLLADLKPLDIILETYRRTILQLEEMTHELRETFHARALMMLIIIMTQIVELIRVGCDELLHGAGVSDRRNSRRQSSNLNFGFGALQPDLNEQRSWRAQIVIKELQRGRRLLDQLSTLGSSCKGQSDGKATTSVAIVIDLDHKLERLISQLQSLRSV